MFIELQVTSQSFLSAQLLGLQSMKLTFPPPISLGGFQFVVDHVEFGQNSFRQGNLAPKSVYYTQALYGQQYDTVRGFQVLMAQPVAVFLADLDDIMNHPNNSPAHLISINTTILVELRYSINGLGNDVLITSVDHIEMNPLPPLPPGVDATLLQQQIISFVKGLIPFTNNPLGLANNAVGTNANVINTDLSIDSTFSRLAFR